MSDQATCQRQLREVLLNRTAQLFELEEQGYLRYTVPDHNPQSNVIVALGPNGVGKSLLGRLFEANAQRVPLVCRMLSMKNRTSGAFGQRLIFGDESMDATGLNSAKALQTLLKSMDGNDRCCAGMDEPTLGLSLSYSWAIGELVGQWALRNPNCSLYICSHDREFLSGLVDTLKIAGGAWSTLNLYNDEQTLEQWLAAPIERLTLAELEEREKEAFKMSCAVEKWFRR